MTGLADRVCPPAQASYPGPHLGLRWRSILPQDGPAVYRLILEIEDHDHAIHRTSLRAVAAMIAGCTETDWLDVIVGLDAQRTIVAIASVRVMGNLDGVATAIVNAFVHPHWRGRGIGRSLLYWQDARARQMLVEHFGADSDAPAYIANGVDSHMTDRRRLYIAAGYYACRTFQLMYRELEGSEQLPSPRDGYTIVPWGSVPTEQVKALHMDVFTAHFWPHFREQWWNEAMDELVPSWSCLALSPSGELAGYLTVGRPDLRWVLEGRKEAYATLLGVNPDHRGHGLAGLLLRTAIVAASRAGMTRFGLDVDTHNASHAHEIYEHYGFVDERAEVVYAIEH